jgi:hypothetical protein
MTDSGWWKANPDIKCQAIDGRKSRPDVVRQAVQCKKQAKIACQAVHGRKYRPDIACQAVPGVGSTCQPVHGKKYWLNIASQRLHGRKCSAGTRSSR